ncbi:MerR family transcriptional regulator [Kribbella sindirgiensis]|uniref:MerR family transcriptional regulator n=1 Tax=Kribbella sindirgiensis TaxID=1124744 RepID=A0A4V2M2M5_9ACTN|nr:MerR family transcriptional regulator [Kribbella sindirgiensis]TCC28762.1 MerR family transcriptional regulator [Kribbella sindirgiensis]
MFTIGDFAAFGQVSARMLRHYDALGLLRPAVVDAATGYRFYSADQFSRLNRIVALKDLGFSLQQVGQIVDAKLSAEELRGMLRLRQAQLEDELARSAARLTSVEARLRLIEREGHMPTDDVVLKNIAPARVAELSAISPSYDGADIGPVLQPLFGQLFERLGAAGLHPCGSPVAYYEDAENETIRVHAAVPVETGTAADVDITELPALNAATIVHQGDMMEADRSMQTLARWIEDNGYRSQGYAREVTVQFDPDNPANWVHEFQIAVTKPS